MMFTAYYNMDFNPFSNEIETKYNFISNDFTQATVKLEILRTHKGIWILKIHVSLYLVDSQNFYSFLSDKGIGQCRDTT
ncbi:MAG: hypothetical protein N2448_02260 [Caloramator sp.]|nr:hypothetical protein [Caloramator sp.]